MKLSFRARNQHQSWAMHRLQTTPELWAGRCLSQACVLWALASVSGISPVADSSAAINSAAASGGATMKSPIFVLVILITLTTSSVLAVESWKEFAVWPTTDDQELPDMDGDIVVWQQFVADYGDYDIYVVDMNSPDEPLVAIIGDDNDQMCPAVFENIVVWQDFIVQEGLGDWDIWACDISNFEQPVFFAVSNILDNDEQSPAIHGNIVVWQDGAEGDYDIYGADITDPERPMEFAVAAFERNQWWPAIYRNTVVWQDSYYGDEDIIAADIWMRNKPAEFGVSLLEFDQQRSAIWGDIVVWADNYFGDMDIYAADLSPALNAGISDPNNPVEFAIVNNEAEQTNPNIDGNIVVWQDNRNGDWDIYGYNLTTRQEFQITDNPYDQTNPAVSGNTVVWEDSRDGNLQIYAVILDGPEVAICTSKLAGDINGDCKVDFDDQAIMLSQWLECNLEPEEACISF
jgi:beta propeller repeat protein